MKYVLLFVDTEEFAGELQAMSPAERARAFERVKWMKSRSSGFWPILLRAGPAQVCAALGSVRAIGPLGAPPERAVAAYLAADGGRAATEFDCDLADGRLLAQPVSDVDAVRFPQVARRAGRGRRPHRGRCPLPVPGRGRFRGANASRFDG